MIQKLYICIQKDKDRWKLCRNCNSNFSKYLADLAQLNFQNANRIKAALKLEASVTNAATYYFSSIKAILLLVILSLNPLPAALHLRNGMLIKLHRLVRFKARAPSSLFKMKLQLVWKSLCKRLLLKEYLQKPGVKVSNHPFNFKMRLLHRCFPVIIA